MLGKFLNQQYLADAPKRYTLAFLFGCTEPDKNPITYLKGSLRSQWLRGHNWESSRKYMERLSRRLERRKRLHLIDFYTMGKLIHYTTDAFTHAHNKNFSGDLQLHRDYERRLQNYFLSYLENPQKDFSLAGSSAMDTICISHRRYAQFPTDIFRDSRYCVNVTCMVMAALLA